MGSKPGRCRRELDAVLRTGFDRIRAVAPGLRYRLVGTAAACLQGVDLPVGDVDILVDRRDSVDAVAEALADLPCVTAPQWHRIGPAVLRLLQHRRRRIQRQHLGSTVL
ncbi:hypothetical protein [Streptomyces sp. SD31]|uniref:hypothetical protein n=1 Tax=Streptomyces sp. SD31 TaxID=3452208 RepID=UPI003F8869E8